MKKMLYPTLVLLTAATVFLAGEVAMAQTTAASKNPVEVFLGKWEGGGTFYATKLSKAGSVTSHGDCGWSPQKRYLVCEQTIQESGATHGQITLFTPGDKPDEVIYCTLNQGQNAPSYGTVEIQNNVWTFSGKEFPLDGVPTTVRTTNTFEGDRESFRVEYSQDKGAHWTTMLDGKQHRARSK